MYPAGGRRERRINMRDTVCIANYEAKYDTRQYKGPFRTVNPTDGRKPISPLLVIAQKQGSRAQGSYGHELDGGER
jgi:hypothetical protein